MTRITLDYPPSANRYWRNVNGRMVRSREATAYKEAVGWLCNTAGIELCAGEVCVTLRLYRPAKRGDLDNRLKIVLDALQGYAYHNDGQIAELHATRHEDKSNPRAEIEIMELTS